MQSKFDERITAVAAVASIVLGVTGLGSLGMPNAIGSPSGEEVFKANCTACHAGGGNIVNPKKPLKGSKKLASKDCFKDFLLKGSGAMPGFPKIVNDAPTLDALYSYCKNLK